MKWWRCEAASAQPSLPLCIAMQEADFSQGDCTASPRWEVFNCLHREQPQRQLLHITLHSGRRRKEALRKFCCITRCKRVFFSHLLTDGQLSSKPANRSDFGTSYIWGFFSALCLLSALRVEYFWWFSMLSCWVSPAVMGPDCVLTQWCLWVSSTSGYSMILQLFLKSPLPCLPVKKLSPDFCWVEVRWFFSNL